MEVSGRNQAESDNADSIQCDPCLLENEIVSAEFYCTDCSEYFCNNCARAHRKSKATRHHKLLDGLEMPKKKFTTVQEKFCSKHNGKLIEYFCEKHEQLCCSVCATLGHSQCGVLYIDDIAGGFDTSQEYQDLLKQIKLLETKLTETKKLSEKNCRDVKQCCTSLISDIQQFRSQINTKLDEIVRTLKDKAQKIKSHDLKSMESISTQTENIQKRLSEMSSTLESLEKYKQNQQLFITTKASLKQVMDFSKQTDKISLENKIRKYSFSWNEEILQSLESCCELVNLNVKGREKRNLQKEKQSQGEGSIMYKDPKQIKAKFEKNINIQHKQDREISCWITGSDLLTCDTLALTDRDNSSVKLVDLHTDAITSCLQLADQPWDLTCMDSNTMVVTCGTNLTFLKFDGNLSVMKKIPVEDGCYGITSHQNKLFVTFIGEKPCVKILNSAGAVLQTIQTNSQGQNLFVAPEYITLGTDGRTFYVSDWDQHTVTSYNVTGGQINVYKHGELKRPQGLTVIENKFLFVCGYRSDNLHEISGLCEHIQIVLDRKDVGGRPWTVLYNRTNSKIYISCYGNKFVSVFKLE